MTAVDVQEGLIVAGFYAVFHGHSVVLIDLIQKLKHLLVDAIRTRSDDQTYHIFG